METGYVQRVTWIDAMRGVCMFMVILYHSGAPVEYDKFLIPFFLSGFFFLSGYLFYTPGSRWDWKHKLIRVVETLLIPYLLYWTLTYFVKAFYYDVYLHDNWDILLPYFCELLSGSKLWFISALIVGEIVLTGILSVSQNVWFLGGLIVVVSLVWWFTPLSVPGVFWPWYLPSACIGLCFMLLGAIVRQKGWLDYLERRWVAVSVVVFYLLLYVMDLAFNIIRISFASNYFENLLLFYVYALCGLSFLYVVCKNCLGKSRFLCYIGRNTLLMYFFCNQVILLIARVTENGWGMSAYVWSVVAACLACLLLVVPVEVTKRWLPWMAGKGRISLKE